MIKNLLFVLLSLLLLTCSKVGTNPEVDPSDTGTGILPEELIKPCPPPNPDPSWQIVGDDPISDGAATFTSIVFHKNVPYVLYSDVGSQNKVVVKKYNGNSDSWEDVGNEISVGKQAQNSSIAIDSSGNIYVSFSKDNNYPRTSVIKYNGTSWENVGSPTLNNDKTTSTSIAIGKNDIPYLVYSDEASAIEINTKVLKYQGSWQRVGDNLAGLGGDVVFIAINRSGRPFVIYKPSIGGSKKVIVREYNGSSWASVGGDDGISAGVDAGYPSIVLNPLNNEIYAVFSDGGVAGTKTVVKKYNGGSWVSVGSSSGISTGAAKYDSIALNNDLKPYVIFSDEGQGRKAVVKKYNGSSWVGVGLVSGISTGVANYTDIAISSDCVPYVVFSDHGEGSKAVVMKYE